MSEDVNASELKKTDESHTKKPSIKSIYVPQQAA